MASPARPPSVDVDSYNLELRDDDGFIGDRVTKSVFRDLIESWRAMRASPIAPITRAEKIGA